MFRVTRAIALIFLTILAVQITGCSLIDSYLGGASVEPPIEATGGVEPAAEETSSVVAILDSTPELIVPTAAFERVYAEQVQAQHHIVELVEDKVAEIEFGPAEMAGIDALIPVTITYRSGESGGGWLVLSNEQDTWYFTSLRHDRDAPDAPLPADASLEIVEVLTKQQTDAGYQTLLRDGIVTGGVTSMTIGDIVAGPSTTTIEVNLKGSSRFENQRAVFVLVSEGDPDDPEAWFVTKVTMVD